MTPHHRPLSVFLALALALRLAWALVQPTTAAAVDRLPDQREYLTLADGLLRDGYLRLFDPRFGATVVAYRLPGYPAFVAACGASVRAVRVAQAILDTATVLGAFLLGRRWGGSTVGVAAAAAVAVNPLFVYFSGLVLTETAFAAATVWAAWGLTVGGRRGVATAVGCFVIATYLRPTGLVLGPAMAAAVGFWAKPTALPWVRQAHRGAVGLARSANPPPRPAYRLLAAVVVAAALGAALAPWAYRNHRRLGSAVWTTTNDGITAYDGFHDGADGSSDQRFLGPLIERLPALRSMNEVDRSRTFARMARAWAAEHPAAVVRLAVAKVMRGWSPVPLSESFGRPAYRLVGGAYAVPFDVLCLIGLWSRRITRPGKWLLVTPAVVLTAVQAITVGSIRYRMPAEGPLAVLAAVGAVDVFTWGRRRPDATAGQHTAPPV